MKNEDVLKVVNEILDGSDSVKVELNDNRLEPIVESLNKSRTRLWLSQQDISVEIPKGQSYITLTRIGSGVSVQSEETEEEQPIKTESKSSKPKPKRHQHSYIQPAIAGDIIDALIDDASHVLWFKGPTGTGKTVLAHHVCDQLGMELFQINCHASMGAESFFGAKTVEVDEKSNQNHIVFQEGIVTKAMKAGLDKDGNEIPDGKPGLLFIDEAGAMQPQVAIALNRLLESDNPRRTITLEQDGGRIVRSHSKFRIILAANTAGRGASSLDEKIYTAQKAALDISLLNRVAMTFRFGYDRNVERRIAMEKIGNDRIVNQVLGFRDDIRDNIRGRKLSTPFSTRSIVKISDAYRVYNDLKKAIYYTTFEQLLPTEKAVYNEIAVAKGIGDILMDFEQKDMDYM